jgi:hypothetical protein
MSSSTHAMVSKSCVTFVLCRSNSGLRDESCVEVKYSKKKKRIGTTVLANIPNQSKLISYKRVSISPIAIIFNPRSTHHPHFGIQS